MLDALTVKERVSAAAGLTGPTIDTMVASAQALIESQTGRYFGLPTSTVEIVVGYGGYLLYLPDKLQTGTPTVQERSYPGASPTAITGFTVRQGRAATQLARTDGQRWNLGWEYEVTYTRGYVGNAGPADVLQLALDLIALRLAGQGQEGVQSASAGAYSYTRFGADDLAALPGAAAVLNSWRRLVAA